MSWWTDLRDGTLNELGLGTTSDLSKKLSKEAQNAVKSTKGGSDVKQMVPEVVKNPWNQFAEQASQQKVAGIALPLLIAGGAALFLLLRK